MARVIHTCYDSHVLFVTCHPWSKENERMQDALESAATTVFDQETVQKYIISDTPSHILMFHYI
ncbi:hypothetical protein DPMN_022106 [Dreissena polymorpha]|uniref:Uncharacterized protein n=1 Tax=Dreissena polymorpha TaxID=45954 RepID=A0A9D4NNV2_DREPO|nr:hypothetical protein DPMN_022106 [Dreissena polymorpha]